MKNFLLGFAVLILIIGLYNFIKHVGYFSELSPYGKGYLTGSLVFIILGVVISFTIIKQKIRSSKISK